MYVDPSGMVWCERIPKFPWIRCHWGKKPPGDSGCNVPLPPKTPKPIKICDKVVSNCQDAADQADASMICMEAYTNWSIGGADLNTCDPIMRAMFDKHGRETVESMTELRFKDTCAKMLTGQGMGDLIKEWTELYCKIK